jgi:hypothetical protein
LHLLDLLRLDSAVRTSNPIQFDHHRRAALKTRQIAHLPLIDLVDRYAAERPEVGVLWVRARGEKGPVDRNPVGLGFVRSKRRAAISKCACVADSSP